MIDPTILLLVETASSLGTGINENKSIFERNRSVLLRDYLL